MRVLRLCASLAMMFAALALIPASPAVALDSSCVDCHALEEDEDLSAPVGDWRNSVHGRAEVSCDACHGGNPFESDAELSMDEAAGYVGAPGWAEVPQFCGACHEDISQAYRQGVLGQQLSRGEQAPVCSNCHGAHAVAHPDPHEILTTERCGECEDFRTLVAEMEAQFSGLDADLASIRARIDVSGLDQELTRLRQETVIRLHSYDRLRIESAAEQAAGRIAEMESEAAELGEVAEARAIVGLGVVGALLMGGLGAFRLGAQARNGDPRS